MYKRRNTYFLFATLALFLVITKVGAVTLDGGTQYNEIIDNNVHVGDTWNGLQQLGQNQTDDWFPVPRGMQGIWLMQTISIINPKTRQPGSPRKTVIKEPMGQQADKSGMIWHCFRVPERTYTDAEQISSVKIITLHNIINGSADSVDTVQSGRSIIYDKQTARVLNVFPYSQITRWRLIDENTVMQEASYNDPTKPYQFVAALNRIANFTPIDIDVDGYNYKESFKKYLISHNMQELIPD